jgi:hypothetical protein
MTGTPETSAADHEARHAASEAAIRVALERERLGMVRVLGVMRAVATSAWMVLGVVFDLNDLPYITAYWGASLALALLTRGSDTWARRAVFAPMFLDLPLYCMVQWMGIPRAITPTFAVGASIFGLMMVTAASMLTLRPGVILSTGLAACIAAPILLSRERAGDGWSWRPVQVAAVRGRSEGVATFMPVSLAS